MITPNWYWMFLQVAIAVFGAAANIVGILSHTALQREASAHVIGRITSAVQICQYLALPPLVWLLGKYASLPRGYMLHEVPLRDGFVAAALVMGVLAVVSLFVAVPFLRQHDSFVFGPEALAPDRVICLFDRQSGLLRKAAEVPLPKQEEDEDGAMA